MENSLPAKSEEIPSSSVKLDGILNDEIRIERYSGTSDDFKLEITQEYDDESASFINELKFITEKEKKSLYLDIKESGAMARDLLIDRYSNRYPKCQDLPEAISYIMNTSKYIDRIEGLVKYERHRFLQQRPELLSKDLDIKEMSTNCRNIDGEMNVNDSKEHTKSKSSVNDEGTNNPTYVSYIDTCPAIYGQHILTVLEKLIDSVEAKVAGEEDDDYKYRREQSAIEFVTSYHEWRCFEQGNAGRVNDSVLIQHHTYIDKFFIECYKEGCDLLQKKKYKCAAFKLLDAIFACMCKPRDANGKTANILQFLNNGSKCEDKCGEDSNEMSDASEQSEKSDIDCPKNSHRYACYSNDGIATNRLKEDTEPEDYEYIPHDQLFLDCKIKLVECTLKNKQLKKASRYANHLMQWMCYKEAFGYIGYYAITYPEKYSLLESYYGEAECQLGNYKRAIEGCTFAINQYMQLGHNLVTFDRSMFAVRQNFFDRLVDVWDVNSSLNVDGNLDVEVLDAAAEEDRSNAKIIVDKNREKGVVNGKTQFVVNDIDAAVRIAKDGDVIFLEEGTYEGGKIGKKGDGSRERIIDISKNVEIIGVHTSKVQVLGSVVKRSSGQVTFRRVTFQVGKDQDSRQSIYAMCGTTKMVDCSIKSPANTAIHVISQDPNQDTVLNLEFCIIDGMKYCERILTFEGYRPVINVESCHVSDTLSFCLVLAPEQHSFISMNVSNTLFLQVQDGIKIVLNHESPGPPIVNVRGCHFVLTAYRTEDGSPSIAFCQTAGIAKLENNFVYMDSHDVPTTGFSLHSLKHAELIMNLIESTSDVPRQFSMNQGAMITECLNIKIQAVEINGMRIGIKFTNKIDDELNSIFVQDCVMKCCSVGLSIDESWHVGDTKRENEPTIGNASSKDSPSPNKINAEQEQEKDKGIVSDPEEIEVNKMLVTKILSQNNKEQEVEIEPNINLKMSGCYLESCYYGLLNQSAKVKLCVELNTLQNVPKGMLLLHSSLSDENLVFEKNQFQFSDIFHSSEVNFEDANEVESLRKTMYINFSVYENISHRVAYQKKHFYIISSDLDVSFLLGNKLSATTTECSIDENDASFDGSVTRYKEMI